ncbi:MarR family winged helix-turn-helix transcriptional regulator [Phenylobacterium sp.]|uniref:MarR family winged helix-turn-helix transcriptional regulator n=1 Tax=Phenylobacterium sp. TaxID=1871053 RepID=UPI002731E3EA|nr:MarR family transcriptional regulator [Phenylobacterium sp.]MDP1872657.1 MarR family transcriptional regulator [Phenylobacterium sp.]MDP3299470.1 MarR family transcriptional regulator [Phenylobacterium sp.]
MAKDKGSGDATPGVSALDGSPSHLLHRALQVSLDIYAETFSDSDLTQRQYAVLSAVEAQEGLTQTDLVRATGIDRSTLADMAARMIAKGLLARERSQADARANAVRLTEAGAAVLAEARPRMATADERLMRLISGSKRETFLVQLRQMVAAGEAGAEAQSPDVATKPAKLKKDKSSKDKAPKDRGAKGEGKKKKKAKKAA